MAIIVESELSKSRLLRGVSKDLKHHTHLFGIFNGKKFDFDGGGNGKPYEGRLFSHLNSTMGSVNFQPHLLSPIMIMGYPTFSKYQKGGYDLFKISNGYTYTRSLKFSCGGTMETHHDIKRTDDGLEGEFEVTEANLDSPKIVDIEPTVETFLPAGPGKIKSHFKVRWITEDNDIYSADVDSEYQLNHSLELPFPHFRLVNFETDHTDTRLKQDEILTVINDFDHVNQVI